MNVNYKLPFFSTCSALDEGHRLPSRLISDRLTDIQRSVVQVGVTLNNVHICTYQPPIFDFPQDADSGDEEDGYHEIIVRIFYRTKYLVTVVSLSKSPTPFNFLPVIINHWYK